MKIKTFIYDATRKRNALDAASKLDEMVAEKLGTNIKIYDIKDEIMEYPHLKEYIHQRIVRYD